MSQVHETFASRRVAPKWPCRLTALALVAMIVSIAWFGADGGRTTLAASPRLSLNTTSASPGATISARGHRFPRSSYGQLIWDSDGHC